MKIPDFLSHLRVDDRGRPVPFVNRWGPESTERLAIRHDSHVGGLALFDDDDAELEPDFKAQNLQRQRLCVAEGRCQVCARPIPWSRRFLVISGMSVDFVYVESVRRTLPVIAEPWLDERCMDFAMTKCPGLIRRSRADDINVVKVTRQRDAQLVVSRGWVEGHLEEQSRREAPAMWCKIALTRVDIRRLDAE